MVTKIVVGLDGSDLSFRARDWAVDLARDTGAGLTLVHAFEPLAALETAPPPVDFAALREEAQILLDGSWSEPAREAGVRTDTVLSETKPADAVLEAVEAVGADLVVVGTHGRGVVQRVVLGSVAWALLQRCPCPLTIVR